MNLVTSSAGQMAAIHGELDRLAGLLDVRVQKRISRELWNELAGVIFSLGPSLVSAQSMVFGFNHPSSMTDLVVSVCRFWPASDAFY